MGGLLRGIHDLRAGTAPVYRDRGTRILMYRVLPERGGDTSWPAVVSEPRP